MKTPTKTPKKTRKKAQKGTSKKKLDPQAKNRIEETPKKKPGRPPKTRPEHTQEYWDEKLHNLHLGLNCAEPKWQVLACNFVNENGKRMTLESLGTGESITQQTDQLASVYQEAGADESIVLSAEWQRSLEYLYIIAELKSPEDQGAALKKLFLEDARSRHWEHPIDFSCAGTPEEFRARCAESQVEIELEFPIVNIKGYSLSPDN